MELAGIRISQLQKDRRILGRTGGERLQPDELILTRVEQQRREHVERPVVRLAVVEIGDRLARTADPLRGVEQVDILLKRIDIL